MRRIYFLKYNNYFNRRVKKEALLNDYLPYAIEIRHSDKNETVANSDGSSTTYVEANTSNRNSYVDCNFEYKDGVNTELILSAPTKEVGWNADLANSCDYILVTNNGGIDSHWFVIGNTVISGGRRKFILRRDVIVDNMALIKAADTQIERAMLDNSDTLIYQSEGHNFNQIKEEEVLIKQDDTELEWYAVYLAKDRGKKVVEGNTDYDRVAISADIPQREIITLPSITSFPFARRATATGYTSTVKVELKHYVTLLGQTNGSPYVHYYMPVDTKNHQEGIYWDGNLNNAYPGYREVTTSNVSNRWRFKRASVANPENYTSYILPHKFEQLEGYLPTLKAGNYYYENTYKQLFDYRDKIIYCQDTQKYYKISWNTDIFLDTELSLTMANYLYNHADDDNSEWKFFKSLYDQGIIFYREPEKTSYQNFDSSIKLQLKTKRYNVTLTEITANEATGRVRLWGHINPMYRNDDSYPKSKKFGKEQTADAQYDVILIPYGDYSFNAQVDDPESVLQYSGNSSKAAIDTFVSNLKQFIGDYVYDVQKLPYAPEVCLPKTTGSYNYEMYRESNGSRTRGMRYSFREYGTIGIRTYIGEQSTLSLGGIYFYLPSSSFRYTTFLSSPYSYDNLDNVDFKVEQETSFFRLCSPSFGAMYEFKGTENNGLHSFDINCTFKPYSPYIQINPDWDGIYGDDFDDSRGLICDNGFSMTQISNAWTEYQLQNANFQKVFDRQIESQQFSSDKQYMLDMISGVAGSTSGMSSGAITGMMVGGPAGALIGGTVGGGLSLAAGIADAQLSKSIREEQISASKDIHKLNLASVQARPNTLNKLDAFDVNNKKWCVLERWSASAREKTLLKDYIKYQSMSVGAIGRIADYLEAEESFIKGKILRIGTGSVISYCNGEVLQAINEELGMGVYWSL